MSEATSEDESTDWFPIVWFASIAVLLIVALGQVVYSVVHEVRELERDPAACARLAAVRSDPESALSRTRADELELDAAWVRAGCEEGR